MVIVTRLVHRSFSICIIEQIEVPEGNMGERGRKFDKYNSIHNIVLVKLSSPMYILQIHVITLGEREF